MTKKAKLQEQEKFEEHLDETVEEMFDRWEREEIIEEIIREAQRKVRIEFETQKEEEIKKAYEESKLKGKIEGIIEGELKGKLDFLQRLIIKNFSHETLIELCNNLTEQQVSIVENHVKEHGIVPVEDLLGLISEMPASLEHAV